MEVARLGYERRKLPTFLVMLFSSLEALDARGCPEAGGEWERIGDWLGDMYDRLEAAGDPDALEDISLFVFENYLAQGCDFRIVLRACRPPRVARARSQREPTLLLGGLDEPRQRLVVQEAAANGGVSLASSWAALKGL